MQDLRNATISGTAIKPLVVSEALKCVHAPELENIPLPERKWVVEGWIPYHATTALYGDGGVGKSFLALQLMACASLGIPWLGLPTIRAPTLGIFCEDTQDELHLRLARIAAHYEKNLIDFNGLHFISRVGQNNILMDFDGNSSGHITKFLNEIIVSAKNLEAKLVIIDTAADTFGGNENIRPQVRRYIQEALNKIAHAIDGSVVLCAHPSVAGLSSGEGYGGSTAWSNSVRSRLYLERVKNSSEQRGDHYTLSKKKSNYSASGERIDLLSDNGVFQLKYERAKDSVDHMIERNCQKEFVNLMKKLEAEGQYLSIANKSSNYAPKLLRTRLGHYSFKQLENAMQTLLAGGFIKNEAYGPPSKNSRKLIILKELD